MRPHVELIHADDYIWHAAELPGGEGRAAERRLSVDEEDGSCSLQIRFETDWGRGPGILHANTEFYVLDGEMSYGGQRMGKGAYVYIPKGVPGDAITFREGTTILHYREYGDAGFDPVDSTNAPRWDDAYEDVIVIDTEAMKWDPVAVEGPMPGLLIKYLHIDPVSGFYTRLVHASEGWADHRLAHHPCYEEAYTTQGHMTYNFGTLVEGTYFFRPARVKHGHFTSMEGGATWLLRSDGELTNWYTQNEYVRWGGEAVNYGPNGGRMVWSQSTHDLAQPWRDPDDLAHLYKSLQFQWDRGAKDVPYKPHGTGPDPSLVQLAKAFERARMAEHGHGEHTHDDEEAVPTHEAMGLADPRSLEHPDERTDRRSHDWGAGRPYKQGDPTPAPILSSLPVRSRKAGRWDGDGM
ncbi:MAG TPA: DUF4437 domain-containing protein [Actinomycetota bacterium]|nr:DUF4437 domain-containing protein [Actinomycetota bacterium]